MNTEQLKNLKTNIALLDEVDEYTGHAVHIACNTATDHHDGYHTYNRLRGFSCHGPVSDCPDPKNYFAVLAPIKKQAIYRYQSNPDHLEQYYSEIMPFFHEAMLKEYETGDDYIIVDPDAPGNQAIMTLITSRQPWERSYMLPFYKELRDTYDMHPIYALFCMQFFKEEALSPFDSCRDHDPFPTDAYVPYISKFIEKGFDPELATPSFNEGNKEGVFCMWRSPDYLQDDLQDGMVPIPYVEKTVCKQGFFGRVHAISQDNKRNFIENDFIPTIGDVKCAA